MNLPKTCVVDTNVPKTANLATQTNPDATVPDECVLACIKAVEHVVEERCLIIDAGDEIFDEYRQQLSMSGQPGVGDRFIKWVHDHRWSLDASQRISITKNGESYDEFPTHEGLNNFDNSDRKFIAVSNAHPEKPPILQATDSKWWGWRHALAEVGIDVNFLCPEYAEAKYDEKMGT